MLMTWRNDELMFVLPSETKRKKKNYAIETELIKYIHLNQYLCAAI